MNKSYLESLVLREAPTRLENAAPDLLAALKHLLQWPTSSDMQAKAAAAIAKAEETNE